MTKYILSPQKLGYWLYDLITLLIYPTFTFHVSRIYIQLISTCFNM